MHYPNQKKRETSLDLFNKSPQISNEIIILYKLSFPNRNTSRNSQPSAFTIKKLWADIVDKKEAIIPFFNSIKNLLINSKPKEPKDHNWLILKSCDNFKSKTQQNNY